MSFQSQPTSLDNYQFTFAPATSLPNLQTSPMEVGSASPPMIETTSMGAGSASPPMKQSSNNRSNRQYKQQHQHQPVFQSSSPLPSLPSFIRRNPSHLPTPMQQDPSKRFLSMKEREKIQDLRAEIKQLLRKKQKLNQLIVPLEGSFSDGADQISYLSSLLSTYKLNGNALTKIQEFKRKCRTILEKTGLTDETPQYNPNIHLDFVEFKSILGDYLRYLERFHKKFAAQGTPEERAQREQRDRNDATNFALDLGREQEIVQNGGFFD